MLYAIAYDVGTTGVKTCLFSIDGELRLLAGEYEAYELYILPNGGAEQDAEQWWDAMCRSTRRLLARAAVSPKEIGGISFCSQMQGMVLVDREGRALRRPMSYLDQRATREFRDCQTHGLTVSGVALPMLLKSLLITRAASTSVKDPLWKYKWVQKNEPELFARAYKWLDVKEYLICRCTGEFVMTRDSAYSTFLYDTRKGHEGWSAALCRMYGVNEAHLPRLIECTEVAGPLSDRASAELGLAAGTPVYGGGGDATLIGVGAGATRSGDTHVYSGTSGWVGTVIEEQKVDIVSMIAGIVGAKGERALIRLLGKHAAVFMPGLGAIVRGQDEGDAAALRALTDKAALAALHCRALGCRAELSAFDCALMRAVYRLKYAKMKKG